MGKKMGKGHGEGSIATQYADGHAGGPGRPRSGGKPQKSPTMPLLVDYRKVWKQEKEKDEGEVQLRLRKMLEENPEKFQDRMIKLEYLNRQGKRGQQEAVAGGGSPDPATLPVESEDVVVDGGEERVVELIERLLGEWDHAD